MGQQVGIHLKTKVKEMTMTVTRVVCVTSSKGLDSSGKGETMLKVACQAWAHMLPVRWAGMGALAGERCQTYLGEAGEDLGSGMCSCPQCWL